MHITSIKLKGALKNIPTPMTNELPILIGNINKIDESLLRKPIKEKKKAK